MKPFLCLLLLSTLIDTARPASTLIDAGSATDQYFTGGLSYTVQAPTGADGTGRMSSCSPNCTTSSPGFSYKIPVPDGPYVVTLSFSEPASTPPARAFSVTINDQLVLPRLTMPGLMVPFTRSLIVYSADGFITIRFDSIIRSAVISSITVTPLSDVLIAIASPVTFLLSHVISGALPAQPDGSYIISPAADEGIVNLTVFRNGAVMQRGLDYTLRDLINFAVIVPTGSTAGGFVNGNNQNPWVEPTNAWLPTDVVTAEYDRLSFPLKVAMADCWARVKPGAGWSPNAEFICDQ